ncbi:LysR substrate-binding domain-containing protein [Pseudomonas umsongensis]|uniref:LysR substrate-binding domain-containing protein n=1 Tax=Pseudomonas umsongensis TaxID=198618 RepID=UPI00200B2010|nr:LysR substrate-binding domain-containing protein [Pseudomonas umsongensis]MCK8681843.1 LysR substrate-binding domain-containing protein [Pseudomonas umsongensis]
MELRHLRYFEALAGTLNFTRAAEKSHVTQSTLSHQIKQLEDELGLPLFERVGKKVVITEAGETFLNRITPALRQIDEAARGLTDSAEVVSGNLRIGVTHSFNIRLVPDCIAVFLARHPSIRVTVEELTGDAIVQSLSEDRVDIGIAYRPLIHTDLHFEPLFNEELKLVVSKEHPLAKRKKIRMVELHGVRMTLLPTYFSTRQLLDECFLAAGAEPIVVAELNSTQPMVELISKTNLAGIVSEKTVDLRENMRVIPLENPTPMRTPGLLWVRGKPQMEAAKHFVTTIRRKLAENMDA